MIPFKEARHQKGVSQRQIERDTQSPEADARPKCINQATLSRGERGVPFSRPSAAILAKYFGFPWEEQHFLYPERSMTPEEIAERDSHYQAKAS